MVTNINFYNTFLPLFSIVITLSRCFIGGSKSIKSAIKINIFSYLCAFYQKKYNFANMNCS